METRQLEHEGFEHLDEFRRPRMGEYFQASSGKLKLANSDFIDYPPKGGKRWILRKVPIKVDNPQAVAAIKAVDEQIARAGEAFRELDRCVHVVQTQKSILQSSVDKINTLVVKLKEG